MSILGNLNLYKRKIYSILSSNKINNKASITIKKFETTSSQTNYILLL